MNEELKKVIEQGIDNLNGVIEVITKINQRIKDLEERVGKLEKK